MAGAGGGRGRGLAVLLILLAAAGGANYVRNVRAGAAVPRPYRAYSDAELDALLRAYRAEAEALDRRLEATRAQRPDPCPGSLLGERAEAFERLRRHGERLRGLARDAGGHEAVVEALERERALRERLAGGWRLHWSRLVSLQVSSSSSKPRSSPR